MGFLKFGLEDLEIRRVYSLIPNKDDFQKAVACYANIKKDLSVKNHVGCFKKRCSDSNFDDGGLLSNHLKKLETEAAVKASIQKNTPTVNDDVPLVIKNMFPRSHCGKDVK